MSLIYGRNIYKAGALGLLSTFSILQVVRYFDYIDNLIISSITKQNWTQFNIFMTYRNSQNTIINIIDRFSEEVKCKEVDDGCELAIDSAEKLLLHATDSNAKRKAITLLISLAFSVGKIAKISEKVASVIEDVDVFNHILEVLSNHLITSNLQKSKYQTINLIYKILDNSNYDYIPKNDSSVVVLNNIAQYLLECEKLGLLNGRQEKTMDSINNILYKCIDEICLVNGIRILIDTNKTDKISDEIISNIKSSETFNSILNYANEHLNKTKDIEIKNNIIRFIVRMSEKCTESSIDSSIKALISVGKADEISDAVLSKFKNIEKLKKVLENTATYIKESQNVMTSDTFHSFKKENALIMKVVYYCGDKCVGYAMDKFFGQISSSNINLTKYEKAILKQDAYQNIQALSNESMLAKMVTDIVGTKVFQEGSKSSLKDIAFNTMLLDVEKDKFDLHKNQSCVESKKAYFDKIFYGELEVFEGSLYYLKEDIDTCYSEQQIES